MNWEQTIEEIRTKPEFADLVTEAYLEENLTSNVKRFRQSNEFKSTLQEIEKHFSDKRVIKVLDLGAGNGISSVSFALQGYQVVALEPDPSATVGAEAIRISAMNFKTEKNLEVVEAWGESLPFENSSFDLVYGRQVMHHAHELDQFVLEASRVLKTGGMFMTTRDHVIKNEADKEAFLERHPLHKFYGGENAFTYKEYTDAIKNAGLHITASFGPSESPINYDPWDKDKIKAVITQKLGKIFALTPVVNMAWKYQMRRLTNLPGRLYSFVAIKE